MPFLDLDTRNGLQLIRTKRKNNTVTRQKVGVEFCPGESTLSRILITSIP